MKKQITKFTFLMLMASICCLAIIAEPIEESQEWLGIFILIKSVAVFSGLLVALLGRKWYWEELQELAKDEEDEQ